MKQCGRLPKNEDILRDILNFGDDSPSKNKEEVKLKELPSDPCCAKVININSSACCGPSANCCSPIQESVIPDNIETPKRSLEIEFMYIDLEVCTRCLGTESNLEVAISEVAQILKATGVEVTVKKILVEDEEQAIKLGFVTSPTIRINGHDIQLDFKESLCESCGDVCGDMVDCRVWIYQGKEYTEAPKAMLIDAILREVYGGSKTSSERPKITELPENLRNFFLAKRKQQANQNAVEFPDNICCSSPASDKCCGK
ncbi:MAG: DUF2703 domain-containing protein [Firmicutes bacterium]|nr:DUF2703 domain-containing protein [Bacillota bacterium]